MKKVLIFCTVILLAINLFAQESGQATAIPATNKVAITRLTNQIKSFPQEKVYLQIDRPYYSAGERLWFRINMVHATLHSPLVASRYVYVELINAHNEVMVRKKIRPNDESMYFGQMDLSPELAAGWYSIRAYTNFMRNIDEDFFFRQRLYIGNPLKGLNGVTINEKNSDNNSSANSTTKEKKPYNVQFFPEGGNLISGNLQKVGFKAISQNGLGTEISGRIVDEQNNEVSVFKSSHLGMGTFFMTPVGGKKYTALCEDSRGQRMTLTLPEVSENQYALCVQQNPTILNITVLTPNMAQRTDTLYLLCALRGLPIIQKTFLPDSPGFTFSKKGLQSGITQVLLLNSKGEILSERLVFTSGADKADLALTLDKPNYTKRDAVHATMILKNSQGIPLAGNFSMSVTDDNDIKIDPNESTIESYLLLQSDLKGYIENPNEYFKADNKLADSQLDLLMLTQGWKRYDTKATLAGNFSKGDKYELERGPLISGKVQSFPARRGLSGINVSFLIHKRMQFEAVTTDKNGRFVFECSEFPDSTKFRVDATKKIGSSIEIVIDPDTFPNVNTSCVFPDDMKQDLTMKNFLKKSRDRYNFENGLMSVNLKSVVVTAKKVDKNNDIRRDRGAMYSAPRYSIGEEALSNATSIMDLLMQSPGVTIDGSGTGVLIRNKPPLIMVDNMKYTMDELQYLNVSEVKLIDILKDISETASFGPEGSNGVICIYLKRGGEEINTEPVELGRHQAEITPLGHSLPAEFYVPKYQVEENRLNSAPDMRSTIFWKPNIKSNANGEADAFFYTADSPGTYTIIAEGVTSEGEIIRYQGKLNRK